MASLRDCHKCFQKRCMSDQFQIYELEKRLQTSTMLDGIAFCSVWYWLSFVLPLKQAQEGPKQRPKSLRLAFQLELWSGKVKPQIEERNKSDKDRLCGPQHTRRTQGSEGIQSADIYCKRFELARSYCRGGCSWCDFASSSSSFVQRCHPSIVQGCDGPSL
eukprot:5450709-Amphidinium_carterae.1